MWNFQSVFTGNPKANWRSWVRLNFVVHTANWLTMIVMVHCSTIPVSGTLRFMRRSPDSRYRMSRFRSKVPRQFWRRRSFLMFVQRFHNCLWMLRMTHMVHWYSQRSLHHHPHHHHVHLWLWSLLPLRRQLLEHHLLLKLHSGLSLFRFDQLRHNGR